MRCIWCGYDIPGGEGYCPYCGEPVRKPRGPLITPQDYDADFRGYGQSPARQPAPRHAQPPEEPEDPYAPMYRQMQQDIYEQRQQPRQSPYAQQPPAPQAPPQPYTAHQGPPRVPRYEPAQPPENWQDAQRGGYPQQSVQPQRPLQPARPVQPPRSAQQQPYIPPAQGAYAPKNQWSSQPVPRPAPQRGSAAPDPYGDAYYAADNHDEIYRQSEAPRMSSGAKAFMWIGMILLVALAVFAYLAVFTDVIFTEPAEIITLEEYQQIELGMTYQEVCQIIGGEGTLLEIDPDTLSLNEGADVKQYAWRGNGGAGSQAQILFEDDAVVSMYQVGLT
ncbi:MAG: hypothetical protein ACOX88_04655 [Christensenellales bacterium]|jgi:hypothetical protein